MMRKIIALLIFLTVSYGYAQEPATFTVEVPGGTQSVRMTGNFWAWNPIGGPVASDNGDNTFTVTIFSGGGESQSDMEYLWVITDADNETNPMQENLIDDAQAEYCGYKIDSGEFNTDFSTYANRVFIAMGSDDDINDIYDSCTTPLIELDVVYDELVWSDEFNTAGTNNPIKSSNWHHQTQLPAGGSWFNGEEQHYTDQIENSFEENGNLNIVAIKESFSDQGETKQYTSARLNSKFAFTYGRIDVRAKLPIEDGTWPAIWTLGKNINEDGGYWDPSFGTVGWPACGEIDIMEHGLSTVNHVSSALHTPCCNGGNPNIGGIDISDVENNYHVYSVNWSPDQMTFMVDDVIFYVYNPPVKDASTWPFVEDQYILLNIAMGGVAGTIDPGFSQSSMEIDYVRIYQENPLSTEDLEISNFKAFPNPTQDVWIVRTENQDIVSIQLFDILGKNVLSLTPNNSEAKIDAYNLRAGLYFARINTINDVSIIKLIKK